MRNLLRGNETGCGAWAFVVALGMLLLTGLLIYVDRRFGPEASALLLGLSLGIPLLLVVVLIVGGIYVLVIRGTMHVQERDDRGEVERLRALRELARTEQSFAQRDRAALSLEAKQQRAQPPAPQLPIRWQQADWVDATEQEDEDDTSYWVVK